LYDKENTMITLPRLILTATAACLMTVGCAHKQVVRTTVAPAPATGSSAATRTHSGSVTSHRSTQTKNTQAKSRTVKETLPDHTGVAACDDYLSSYLACHKAAAIYTPDQLQPHYEAMRTSLLRDSQNPDIRPQLESRCNSLATQLREALHGKSCAQTPVPASTTP
jgi:hypothetical protein